MLSYLTHSAKPTILTDEKTLIEGCNKGLESYRYELYKRFSGKMFVVCKRYAGNKEDAQDYLQDGFIRVFQKLNTFQHNGSLEGWIRRVIVHTCLNHLRSRKIMLDLPENTPLHDVNAPNALNDMSEQELLKMISQMPPGYRTIFNLYAIDGFDHAEIAKELSINEGTSRSQLAKARMYLKNTIEKSKIKDTHVNQA
jgi:RNA polymerase sigma factor (sigma-70 family)